MQQLSDEWFAIRKGKISASHAQAIATAGKGLDTYILELMAEYFSSGEKERYTNDDMQRGIELEGQARDMYELEKGVKVKEIGFIEHSDFVGCSPDGLIGEDGGLEIKAQNDPRHFKLLINGVKEVDSKYIWQIQMSMLISGRDWWDFVSYNPNFVRSLAIFRILPDQAKFEKLRTGFIVAEEKINLVKKSYNK